MVQNIKDMIQTRISIIQESLNVLMHYLNTKNSLQDWHGVSDAANDIRELNSEWKALQSVIDFIDKPEGEKENEKDNKLSDESRRPIGINSSIR